MKTTNETLRLPMVNGNFLAHTPMTDAEATAMENAVADKANQAEKDAKKATAGNKQKATKAAKVAAAEANKQMKLAVAAADRACKATKISVARSNSKEAITAFKATKEACKTARKEAAKFKTPKAVEAAVNAKMDMDIAKLASNKAFEAGSDDNRLALAMAKLNNRSNY